MNTFLIFLHGNKNELSIISWKERNRNKIQDQIKVILHCHQLDCINVYGTHYIFFDASKQKQSFIAPSFNKTIRSFHSDACFFRGHGVLVLESNKKKEDLSIQDLLYTIVDYELKERKEMNKKWCSYHQNEQTRSIIESRALLCFR